MDYIKLIMKVDSSLRHVQMTALRIIEAEVAKGGNVPPEFTTLKNELRSPSRSTAFPTSLN
jgi:hypothetical protein